MQITQFKLKRWPPWCSLKSMQVTQPGEKCNEIGIEYVPFHGLIHN